MFIPPLLIISAISDFSSFLASALIQTVLVSEVNKLTSSPTFGLKLQSSILTSVKEPSSLPTVTMSSSIFKMGYTQERLAELVEIDAKNLSKIENGAHSPSFKTLKKLSKVLSFNLSNADNVHQEEPLSKHLYYQKSLKILNSANSPKELQDYYKILKVAHGLINNK